MKQAFKYIILVPDGMADEPVNELGGKTPLEAANTPNMDYFASAGICARVQTIPTGLPPGSDIGNLALMGYEPSKNFSGRAPLEAASMGVKLSEHEIAFRCNLVTVNNGVMHDYSADHISSEHAAVLINYLQDALNDSRIKLYPGKSYRHLMVINTKECGNLNAIKTRAPHDILNQSIKDNFPKGEGEDYLIDLMLRSQEILKNHPLNQSNQTKANMIWLWGQGGRPNLPLFKDRYGLTGSVISAVDLVNGIGVLAGLDIINVPGATGYYDTNYNGKAEYALESLKKHDFVYVHIEAPDEAGHNGDYKAKKEAIENFDRFVVGAVREYVKNNSNVRVLISPDHPTPVAKRTHTSDTVPFVIYGAGIKAEGVVKYGESQAASKGVRFFSGQEMIKFFFNNN